MKRKIVQNLVGLFIACTQLFISAAQNVPAPRERFRTGKERKTIDQKVDSVLRLMRLDEKIGQMNQYNGDWDATGPITKDGDKQNQIRKGMLGSMLNVTGVEHTRTLQEIAMQSRLKIPLLFGQDIILAIEQFFQYRWQKLRAGILQPSGFRQGSLPRRPQRQVCTGHLHRW
jgi:hypothetical protein